MEPQIASKKLRPGFCHPVLRKWQTEFISKSNLVYPIFVTDINGQYSEISSMPGQYRIGADIICQKLKALVDKGLKSVLIFGVYAKENGLLTQKDNNGKIATNLNSPVVQAIALLKKSFPNLLLIADVCLCAYTDHGHCGVLNSKGLIDSAQSKTRLAEIAAFYSKHGADVVAPSDMLDGRVAAIKQMLEAKGLSDTTAVMSYSAKFASCLYGPFRQACSSSPCGGKSSVLKDRSTYQLPPNSTKLALSASLRDQNEGADFVIVKPALFNLNIIQTLKQKLLVPIAAYQVSGEYSAFVHGSKSGAFDLKDVVLESLGALKASGADILITYFAPRVLDWLSED